MRVGNLARTKPAPKPYQTRAKPAPNPHQAPEGATNHDESVDEATPKRFSSTFQDRFDELRQESLARSAH